MIQLKTIVLKNVTDTKERITKLNKIQQNCVNP